VPNWIERAEHVSTVDEGYHCWWQWPANALAEKAHIAALTNNIFFT
jgi:hypothetical protein